MVEQLTGQHHEGVQAQQPLDSAIASFCSGYGKPNTRMAYERDLRVFFRFASEHKIADLSQLTPDFVDEYIQSFNERAISNTTARRRTATLESFLTRTGMEGLAEQTRNIRVRYIRNVEERQPLHSLNNEEVDRLQEVSQDNPRASAIIAIALGTGATTGQIRALNASDVLEQESQIVGIRFRGNKSEREITLDVISSGIVRGYKGDRGGKEPLFVQKPPIKQGEERLGRNGIWNDVKQYGKDIGRPDLKPRILRETFIANREREGPKELAELLGITKYNARRLLERRRLTQQLPQSGVLFEEATK